MLVFEVHLFISVQTTHKGLLLKKKRVKTLQCGQRCKTRYKKVKRNKDLQELDDIHIINVKILKAARVPVPVNDL